MYLQLCRRGSSLVPVHQLGMKFNMIRGYQLVLFAQYSYAIEFHNLLIFNFPLLKLLP